MKVENPFGKVAPQYLQWRPRYPAALFQHLGTLCAEHQRAWDCATGNGQAALDLAEFFAQIEATDVSPEQISQAPSGDRVHYSVQAAEQTSFPDRHFDLITVAQALHWFDHARFWKEVHRVLKPGGVFAAWAYVWPHIATDIDSIVSHQLLKVIRPFWSVKNQIAWDGYRDLEWPFSELLAPAIEFSCDWDCAEFLSFVRTWSATSRCLEHQGEAFFMQFSNALTKAWPASQKKQVRMDFHVRLGRKDQ